MAHYRINRISEEIRKEVSAIIRSDVKDPRIAELSSVVKAEVTGDLRYAKIYVSVLADDEARKSTLEGLKKAAGFIRRNWEDGWIYDIFLSFNLFQIIP